MSISDFMYSPKQWSHTSYLGVGVGHLGDVGGVRDVYKWNNSLNHAQFAMSDYSTYIYKSVMFILFLMLLNGIEQYFFILQNKTRIATTTKPMCKQNKNYDDNKINVWREFHYMIW